jgi:hypothetical protein
VAPAVHATRPEEPRRDPECACSADEVRRVERIQELAGRRAAAEGQTILDAGSCVRVRKFAATFTPTVYYSSTVAGPSKRPFIMTDPNLVYNAYLWADNSVAVVRAVISLWGSFDGSVDVGARTEGALP